MRKHHLRLVGTPDKDPRDALVYWNSEARRLKTADREKAKRIEFLERSLAIYMRSYDVVTRGEREDILKLASNMTDGEHLEWFAELQAILDRTAK
jgi:hypothetical protein